MNRIWTGRTLVMLLVGAGLPAAAVGCAESEAGGRLGPLDGGSIIPESSTGESDGAVLDAGCDAGDPNCNTQIVTCAEVDWCNVLTGVGPAFILKAIWGTNKDDVWAAGSGGTIVHYDGTTWSATPSGTKYTLNALWGSGPDDVYAVSSSTVILHTTGFQAGSATWTRDSVPLDPAFSPTVYAIWGSSASDVRLGANSYTDYNPEPPYDSRQWNQFRGASGDTGTMAWEPLRGDGTIRGIWGASASDVWMLVDKGTPDQPWQVGLTLHGRAGNGPDLTFEEVDSQSSDLLESIHGSSANDVWTVGSHGAIRHITANDTHWQVVASPTIATLHAVWAIGPNDVWAVGESGTILHYDGTSVSFSTAEFPIGPKPALYGVWGSGPNDVWIVGDGITLHYTGPKALGGTP